MVISCMVFIGTLDIHGYWLHTDTDRTKLHGKQKQQESKHNVI